MKKSLRILITLFIVACFSPVLIDVFYTTKVSIGESRMMKEFGKAINKFKKVRAKKPDSKVGILLKDIDKVDAESVNRRAVSAINKKLKKDPEIKKISAKIRQKTDKKPEVIEKVFAQKDPESFPEFEKLLRKSTIKCGGMKLLGSKRSTYEAAAFVTAANYLEHNSK